MTTLIWPPILYPLSERWRVNDVASRGGGRGLTNTEQVVSQPSGVNTASLVVRCNTRARVLAMRGLVEGLDGRAGSVYVGPFEDRRAPWNVDPLSGAKLTYRLNRNPKDPGYASNPDTSPELDFVLQANVSMNATQAVITRNKGGVLQVGMLFSINNRLYAIVGLPGGELGPVNAQGPAGNVTVQFRPWARADYAAGTRIEFGSPTATMSLASDSTGNLDLQLSRLGDVNLDLVETPL